ncbi:MAG TPA: prephenate dehydratase domain-containing protein, partial [Gemmatimonadaceae bacterium]
MSRIATPPAEATALRGRHHSLHTGTVLQKLRRWASFNAMRKPSSPPRPAPASTDAMPLPGSIEETTPQSAPVAVGERLRVAFQGEPGAFSEDAIYALWGMVAEPIPMPTFAAVMEAAEDGDVDFGLLPIESTLAGDVTSAYDLLALHDGLVIAAEVVIPVRL